MILLPLIVVTLFVIASCTPEASNVVKPSGFVLLYGVKPSPFVIFKELISLLICEELLFSTFCKLISLFVVFSLRVLVSVRVVLLPAILSDPCINKVLPFQVSLFPEGFPILNLYPPLEYPKKKPELPVFQPVCPPRICPEVPTFIPREMSPFVSNFCDLFCASVALVLAVLAVF